MTVKKKKSILNRKYDSRKPYKTIYIFTEGEKTEVNYFNDKKEEIIESIRKQNIKIEVMGEGYNTESLVDYAIDYIGKNRLYENDECWVVFDKDDFNKTFNSAIEKAEKNGIHVAYSNEAFELWFLLHFSYLNSAIGRKDYNKKLTNILRQITKDDKVVYNKKIEGMYELIKNKEQSAISGARKLVEEHKNEKSYIKKNPCTTVHLLVESINKLK